MGGDLKQAEDTKTRELAVTKRGRKPIGDKPMTAAERQFKRRTADAFLIASIGSSILEAVMKVGVLDVDQAQRDAVTSDLMQAFDDLRTLSRDRGELARLEAGLAKRPAPGERSEP